MTRETRIGLLVGLLFIIMFGLVLSQWNKSIPPVGVTPAPTANTPALPPDTRIISYHPVMDAQHRPAAPSDGLADTTAPLGGTTGEGGVISTAARGPEDGGSGVDAAVLPRLDRGDLGPVAPAVPGAPATDDRVAVLPPAHETSEIVSVDDLRRRIAESASPPLIAGPHPPSGIPAAPSSAALPPGAKVYEVKAGDSLYAIAKSQYGAGKAAQYKVILDANKDRITNPTALKVGMKLVIPPLPAATPAAPRTGAPTTRPSPVRAVSPTDVAFFAPSRLVPAPAPLVAAAASSKRTHVVAAGDNLFKVAKQYRTTIDEIVKVNSIKNPRQLKIGTRLDIPG